MIETRVKVTGKRNNNISPEERNEMISLLEQVLRRHKFNSHHISVGSEKVVEEQKEQVINPVHDMGAEDEPHDQPVYEAYVEFLKSQY